MNFTIDYPPTPKGVPRSKYVPALGKNITYYHWKTVKALEDIRYIIANMNLEPFPPHVPLRLEVTFYRKKSRWLKGEARREKLPVRKADLDNYIKLLNDAICPLIVPDDAQFTCLLARKRFSDNGQGRIEVYISEDSDVKS